MEDTPERALKRRVEALEHEIEGKQAIAQAMRDTLEIDDENREAPPEPLLLYVSNDPLLPTRCDGC